MQATEVGVLRSNTRQRMIQDFKHSFSVKAAPGEVWPFFWDVEAMARCIPGCEDVSILDEGKSYKARLHRKVGPFLLRFELDINVLESDAPRLIKVEVSGSDRWLKSEITETLTVTLTPIGKDQTRVDMAASFNLTGLLAKMGENLINAHVQQVLDDFVAGVQAAIEERRSAVPV